MAKNIMGLKKLHKAIKRLQAIADEVREELDAKQKWWDGKSPNWQEGEDGEEWQEHFEKVESLLEEIEDISNHEAFENLPETL